MCCSRVIFSLVFQVLRGKTLVINLLTVLHMVYHSQKDVASNCITFGENTPLKLIEDRYTQTVR